MDVAIAGGHGKIALLLEAQLSAAGDRVRAIVRNPDHAEDVRGAGAEPVVCGPDSPMAPYLQAKADADAALAASGLAFTIVRPGSLTDEPATGGVSVHTDLGGRGEVTRADVAATLAAALPEPRAIGTTFEVFAGDTPPAAALAAL